MRYIKTLDELTEADKGLAGGKAVSLGIMKKSGIPVPSGFVLTTEAHEESVHGVISESLQQEIFQAFDNLDCEVVAVRSSALAEDSKNASWAGQFETYTNVRKENLLMYIQKCWSSLDSKKAQSYADQQNHGNRTKMGVVIQKMVISEISGVMFTVNPVTKNTDEVMIEAVFGLGEQLVQGEVTPDNYIIDKNTHTIKNSSHGEQEGGLILDEAEVKKVAELGIRIEELYHHPQDIEWAIEKEEIFIVQARPITTL